MPQLLLPSLEEHASPVTSRAATKGANRLETADRAAHDWYRFVLSFPPHLVREYLERFDVETGRRVLDPFCGTGTTVVECKKLGIGSIGIEANAVARFAGATKANWNVDGRTLLSDAMNVQAAAVSRLQSDQPLRTLTSDAESLLLRDSISPLPLHKTLILLSCIQDFAAPHFHDHFKLALAKGLVGPIGNLHFGPEVGVSKPKSDAPVLEIWLENVRQMARDLETLEDRCEVFSLILDGDSREPMPEIAPASIDAVITSPPYPNEKDYTRTTRLEAVLLGFLSDKTELRSLKKGLMRSNTRGVYKGDEDDVWVAHHAEIQRVADTIEARRIELGKTSGFEKLYARVTRLYFGGMARHLEALKPLLRPGARLAYVVGDQASYLRVMIRTGQLLAEIAEDLGYEVEAIDLFRTRLATATGEQLREEVVVLRWPGKK